MSLHLVLDIFICAILMIVTFGYCDANDNPCKTIKIITISIMCIVFATMHIIDPFKMNQISKITFENEVGTHRINYVTKQYDKYKDTLVYFFDTDEIKNSSVYGELRVDKVSLNSDGNVVITCFTLKNTKDIEYPIVYLILDNTDVSNSLKIDDTVLFTGELKTVSTDYVYVKGELL